MKIEDSMPVPYIRARQSDAATELATQRSEIKMSLLEARATFCVVARRVDAPWSKFKMTRELGSDKYGVSKSVSRYECKSERGAGESFSFSTNAETEGAGAGAGGPYHFFFS